MDNKDETIVENVEIRFDNFDPKDMGILEPIFYHEEIFKKRCLKIDYKVSKICHICKKTEGIFSKLKNCKFCGNVVCRDQSVKRRVDPKDKSKNLRICLICDEKYLVKQIYDEFLEKKISFDSKKELLNFQYGLFNEELKTNQDILNKLRFQRKKILDDNSEIQIEKKKALEQIEENNRDYERKILKIINEITRKKTSLIKFSEEIKKNDQKTLELNEQEIEMENCLKAINLDIRQMKYLITEKNTFLKVETYKKHIKNEDKGKNSTIKNESLETMTTSFSQEERENIRNTNNRNTNNIALNYAIDEKIQISEKGYHCHVCQIF